MRSYATCLVEPSALQAIDLASLAAGGGFAAASYALGKLLRQLTWERRDDTGQRLDALQASVTSTQHLNDERLRSLDQAMVNLDASLKKFSDWAEQVSDEMQKQRSMLLMVQAPPAAQPTVTPQDLQADMLAMQQMAQAKDIEAMQTPLQQEFKRRMDSRAQPAIASQGDPWNQQ